jgi:multidrug resistance efflux pump
MQEKRVGIFSTLLRFLIVGVVAGGAYWFWRCWTPPQPPVTGTVEVDEVHVGSRYGGRIVVLPHQEGETLAAGETIAELDAEELKARRVLMAAQLAEMEHGPRPNEIAAAKQDWEALKAQHAFAEADARRAATLLAQKIIAPAEAQKAGSSAEALQKSAEAAQKRYELLQEGTRPEKVDQARASLAEIDAQLKEMRIVAPAPSVLEVLSVKVGDIVPANREVATLILPDQLWIRVYVPATWLSRLRLGEKATFHPDGEPALSFDGTVEQINRQAEFTPRNVQTAEDRIRQVFGVKVRLQNRDGRLRAGMSGEVRFAHLKPGEAR